jgi:predicted ATPase
VCDFIAIENFRSIRSALMSFGSGVTVIVGQNGAGKSNVLRAFSLLARLARAGLGGALVQEGDLASVLWAGPEVLTREMRHGIRAVQGTRRRGPVSLRLGISSGEIRYAVDVGYSAVPSSAFALESEIKRESIWIGEKLTPTSLVADRRGPMLRLRSDDGLLRIAPATFAGHDSLLMEPSNGAQAPPVAKLRNEIAGWRFHGQFRTDRNAPARQPHVATRRFELSEDGSDVAAVLQTIRETGEELTLRTAIADAFGDETVTIEEHAGYLNMGMQRRGLLRPVTAAELSEGVLRYLMLTATLLAPKPASILFIDEPEISLNRTLLAPLARLVERASKGSQVCIVTHSIDLAERLRSLRGCRYLVITNTAGETLLHDHGLADRPVWRWPPR